MKSADLRAALDSIPSKPKQDQPKLLRKLTKSIRLSRKRYRGKTLYTCFVYATGLLWSQKYIRVAGASGDYSFGAPFFASRAFIEHLISSGTLTEIGSGDVPEESIVIYFANGTPKHAGILIGGGLIRSKWGDGGLLLEHPLLEVPASYGDDVKYYRAISRAEALAAFLDFVRGLPGFAAFEEYCGFRI